MLLQSFAVLATFAVVAGLAPGPNTFMALAAALRADARQTMPQLLGVGWGVFLLTVSIGFGMVGLRAVSPSAYSIVQAIAVAAVVLVAWRIASGRPPGRPDLRNVETNATQLPLSFLQGSAVQVVVPLNWVVAITAMTLHASVRTLAEAILMALAVAICAMLGSAVWVLCRTGLRETLCRVQRLDPFWLGMGGALIVATVMPLASHR